MKSSSLLIGRSYETDKLNILLTSSQAEFLVVYGRRRVGKTFLVRQHLKDNIVFDITGTQHGAKEQQLANFSAECIKLQKGKRKIQPPLNWYQAFDCLVASLKTLPATKKKRVVFIDEMPWLDTAKSEFIPALEFCWNHHLSKMNNVLLIACGSASSWIKKKLINARGGLHNRVTQRINLLPFNLYETELFLKTKGIRLPHYQVLELYM
ncbi:MAG TPA: ATP-binding protein, partial [Ferruginibacter sp.]|nr:ATP-binding protein [Ferruginibacter sp.]